MARVGCPAGVTFVTGIDNKGRLVGYYGPEIGLEGSLGAITPVHGFLAEPISNVAANGILARATLRPLQASKASTPVTPATDASRRRRTPADSRQRFRPKLFGFSH
jgi:hypothetical protein